MNTLLGTSTSGRRRAYQAFKYVVYILLTINVVLFFLDEWDAAGLLFDEGSVPFAELIRYFTASIDSANWVVLLLLFELETYTIPDDKFTPRLALTLNILRGVCYALITYSVYGYIVTWLDLFAYHPVAEGIAICQQLGDDFLQTLDEYVQITADNCAALAQAPELLVHSSVDGEVFTDSISLKDTLGLALVDVINAVTWLLVVIVLEMDVRLQVRGLLEGRINQVSKYIKFVLYSILAAAAIYWGVTGSFLDFWDAFLWLAAFIFIEMNVVEWQEETEAKKKQQSQAST